MTLYTIGIFFVNKQNVNFLYFKDLPHTRNGYMKRNQYRGQRPAKNG